MSLLQACPRKRAHPIYGYDLDKAKFVRCYVCGKLIGDEPYVEELGMARFGSMNLIHAACEDAKHMRARLKMAANWLKNYSPQCVRDRIEREKLPKVCVWQELL